MPENPPSPVDAAIEAYKRDVDRTLIREMLKLTPEERILRLQKFVEFATELRRKTLELGRAATGD